MRQTLASLLIATLAAALVPASASAQDKTTEERVKALETRVSQLELAIENKAGLGGLLILYGAFCALWAQNTSRSAWGWFFLGLFFSVITVIVLLAKNEGDRKRQIGR